MDFGKYAYMAKAITAGIALLVPLLVAIGAALADGKMTIEEITVIGTAAGALASGSYGVYKVTNKERI